MHWAVDYNRKTVVSLREEKGWSLQASVHLSGVYLQPFEAGLSQHQIEQRLVLRIPQGFSKDLFENFEHITYVLWT